MTRVFLMYIGVHERKQNTSTYHYINLNLRVFKLFRIAVEIKPIERRYAVDMNQLLHLDMINCLFS